MIVDGERLATPSGVAEVLDACGLAPRKSLGQNFLVDRRVLARIVEAAKLHPEDAVLEIGPGLGVLTRELAARCRKVVAVEIDGGLVRWLQRLVEAEGAGGRVAVVHGDALTVDWARLLEDAEPGPGGAYKAVANLPYYITSPLLMRLLEEGPPFSVVVVMVQREMAKRLTAAPGTKNYGALTVAVQLRAEVDVVAPVPSAAFFPPPSVDSAVVRLARRPFPEPVADESLLRAAVRTAFGQRRKTVRNAWRRAAVVAGPSPSPEEAVDDALRAVAVDGGRRGETLTPVEFIRIANEFARRGVAFDEER